MTNITLAAFTQLTNPGAAPDAGFLRTHGEQVGCIGKVREFFTLKSTHRQTIGCFLDALKKTHGDGIADMMRAKLLPHLNAGQGLTVGKAREIVSEASRLRQLRDQFITGEGIRGLRISNDLDAALTKWLTTHPVQPPLDSTDAARWQTLRAAVAEGLLAVPCNRMQDLFDAVSEGRVAPLNRMEGYLSPDVLQKALRTLPFPVTEEFLRDALESAPKAPGREPEALESAPESAPEPAPEPAPEALECPPEAIERLHDEMLTLTKTELSHLHDVIAQRLGASGGGWLGDHTEAEITAIRDEALTELISRLMLTRALERKEPLLEKNSLRSIALFDTGPNRPTRLRDEEGLRAYAARRAILKANEAMAASLTNQNDAESPLYQVLSAQMDNDDFRAQGLRVQVAADGAPPNLGFWGDESDVGGIDSWIDVSPDVVDALAHRVHDRIIALGDTKRAQAMQAFADQGRPFGPENEQLARVTEEEAHAVLLDTLNEWVAVVRGVFDVTAPHTDARNFMLEQIFANRDLLTAESYRGLLEGKVEFRREDLAPLQLSDSADQWLQTLDRLFDAVETRRAEAGMSEDFGQAVHQRGIMIALLLFSLLRNRNEARVLYQRLNGALGSALKARLLLESEARLGSVSTEAATRSAWRLSALEYLHQALGWKLGIDMKQRQDDFEAYPRIERREEVPMLALTEADPRVLGNVGLEGASSPAQMQERLKGTARHDALLPLILRSFAPADAASATPLAAAFTGRRAPHEHVRIGNAELDAETSEEAAIQAFTRFLWPESPDKTRSPAEAIQLQIVSALVGGALDKKVVEWSLEAIAPHLDIQKAGAFERTVTLTREGEDCMLDLQLAAPLSACNGCALDPAQSRFESVIRIRLGEVVLTPPRFRAEGFSILRLDFRLSLATADGEPTNLFVGNSRFPR